MHDVFKNLYFSYSRDTVFYGSMKVRFKLYKSFLLKPAVLMSLFGQFFLLNSYIFMTPDNEVLAKFKFSEKTRQSF